LDLYRHCPTRLHGVVLNSLSIGTTLSYHVRERSCIPISSPVTVKPRFVVIVGGGPEKNDEYGKTINPGLIDRRLTVNGYWGGGGGLNPDQWWANCERNEAASVSMSECVDFHEATSPYTGSLKRFPVTKLNGRHVSNVVRKLGTTETVLPA
jgi:hypothetical protein